MSPKNIRLSAIIIAKDEEPRMALCLAALTGADEIIVADNGSTDNTADVARRAGASVFAVSTNDFSEIRNEASRRAHGEWLLFVDADEIVSAELMKEISAIILTPARHAAYELRRVNYYLDTRWPTEEWMIRLMQKDALIRWEGKIHESPRIRGTVSRLTQSIIHRTHRNLSEMVAKTNEWSETEAGLRFKTNHPPVTWWRILRVMATGFIDSYVRQGGWRVGTAGLVEGIFQGFSMFVTYAKLWEMQIGRTKTK